MGAAEFKRDRTNLMDDKRPNIDIYHLLTSVTVHCNSLNGTERPMDQRDGGKDDRRIE